MERLQVSIFLWKGCVTGRKHERSLKQKVSSTSAFQTLSNFANLGCHCVSKTMDRGTRRRDAKRYPSSVILQATRLGKFPNCRFPPTASARAQSPRVSSGRVPHDIWSAELSVLRSVAEQEA